MSGFVLTRNVRLLPFLGSTQMQGAQDGGDPEDEHERTTAAAIWMRRQSRRRSFLCNNEILVFLVCVRNREQDDPKSDKREYPVEGLKK
jgi:hypothetical protein